MNNCRKFQFNGINTDYLIYSDNSGVFSLKNNKFLKPTIDRNGYVVYTLYINGKPKKFGYHQLVAETFLEKPQFDCEVDHITGNKQRNSATDLEWVTRRENVRRSVKLGLKTFKSGELNPNGKYSDEIVSSAIKMLQNGTPIGTVATKLQLPKRYVYGIVSGKDRPDLTRDITFPDSIYARSSKNRKKLPKEVVSDIKFRKQFLNETAPEIASKLGLEVRQVYQAYYYK